MKKWSQMDREKAEAVRITFCHAAGCLEPSPLYNGLRVFCEYHGGPDAEMRKEVSND